MSSPRLYPGLLLLACLGAFAVALTTQYGFGLKPCVLCIYQRIPYAVAAVLALVALSSKMPPGLRRGLVALCAVAFMVDCGIAIFHVGVEHHWWEGLAACVGGGPQASDAASLRAMLAGPPPVPCDQIPWSLFGVSMAGYNALFAFCLTVFAAWSTGQLKERA